MRLRSSLATMLLLAAVAGCGGSSSPDAAATSPAASASAGPVGRQVSFTATDGFRLSGRQYGGGRTAVVLSNMGDNDPSLWESFAPKLAERGYLAMTYSYR